MRGYLSVSLIRLYVYLYDLQMGVMVAGSTRGPVAVFGNIVTQRDSTFPTVISQACPRS
jgi:hypothetical protein